MRLIREFINKTAWNTKQLRALCLAVIRHEGSGNHWIRIRYKTRRCEYHGLATINGTSIDMFVPRPVKTIKRAKYITGDDGKQKWAGERKQVGNWIRWVGGWEYTKQQVTFDSQCFARVLTHEIHHNLGIRHEVMAGVSVLNCEYVKGLVVEPHKSPPKPQINRVELNRERAEANLKRAQTRYKRAQTLLKRCERKMRYYEAKGRQAPA
ncbi:hypothetical protein MUP79_03210 [Candidatus Bathyarchaeota archaeon]|nr:hypothetical protein [Candidatus Bathyarchaeota archaeon]